MMYESKKKRGDDLELPNLQLEYLVAFGSHLGHLF